MKNSLMKTALCSVSAVFLMTQPVWANDINRQALELAGTQNFDQALSLLSAQSAVQKQSYEHRFLEARILSWAGRYPEARKTLSALMAEHPRNADLELAMGNLEYYQGNLDAAEQRYQNVLNLAPDYTDAQTGLSNIRKAREAKSNPEGYNWRIDGGTSFSSFDQDTFSDWNEQFLRAEYKTGGFAYSGSVSHYNRFDANDVQLGLGLADAVRGGLDWGLTADLTPKSDFRSNFGLGGRIGHEIATGSETVYYLNASYKYDDYDTGNIHTLQPELTAYLKNGIVLTGRLIGTFQENEDTQIGWLTEARAPLIDRLQGRIGYANAPETLNGLAISTQSLFGGLTYSVRDDLDLHLNLSRHDREDISVRESLNVGFTHKR